MVEGGEVIRCQLSCNWTSQDIVYKLRYFHPTRVSTAKRRCTCKIVPPSTNGDDERCNVHTVKHTARCMCYGFAVFGNMPHRLVDSTWIQSIRSKEHRTKLRLATLALAALPLTEKICWLMVNIPHLVVVRTFADVSERDGLGSHPPTGERRRRLGAIFRLWLHRGGLFKTEKKKTCVWTYVGRANVSSAHMG